jgi:cytochrome c peroxidase
MKFPTFPDSYLRREVRFERHRARERDQGRCGQERLAGAGLRNLVYTAPYFHNGLVHTIGEAVRIMASTQLNKTLSDAQVSDIVVFLESLSGPFPTQQMPRCHRHRET